MRSNQEIIIKPRSGWQPVDLKELWLHRELLGFLVWRDVKIRYKQTVLGGLWAILQPLIAMVIFGALFSRVTNIRIEGPPYLLFVFTGLVPWTFFANAVSLSSNSIVGSEQMIRKIYFPRMLMPLGSILALTFDMLICFGFLAAMMIYYQYGVTSQIFLLPVFILGSFLAASGLGLLFSALNVQYRDVKYIVPFIVQMGFFVTPVVYPASAVPANLAFLIDLNPMTGLVEGYRHVILGTSISWPLALKGMLVSFGLFLAGIVLFRRMERNFADVI